jgi:hypothetical protein
LPRENLATEALRNAIGEQGSLRCSQRGEI